MTHIQQRNFTVLPAAALFGLALVVFGLLQDPLPVILDGMRVILTSEGALITDYIALAGMGAAFVSFVGCRYSVILGTLIGVLIGFLMPAVSAYTYHIQNGMNLYGIGFACGLMAMMLVPAFKSLGLEPETASHWSAGNDLWLGGALGMLCAVLIGIGFSHGPKKVWADYRKLVRTSGRSPSDYLRVFGGPPVLVNMGINGLISVGYVLLIGGNLNGATLGGIFTIMGFSAYGKHARNIVPVMAGVLLGGLLWRVPVNSTSLQLAGLFGTTLAPFSGFFGWPFGILAGLLHSAVVLHAGLPLEGLNLYNNGFSGGLVAIVLYPVITSLVRHRRPVLQNEELLDAFESDAPQAYSELDSHKDDDVQMPH